MHFSTFCQIQKKMQTNAVKSMTTNKQNTVNELEYWETTSFNNAFTTTLLM